MYGAEKGLLSLLKGLDKSKINPIVVLPRDGIFNEELQKYDITTYIVNCPWWVRGNYNLFALIWSVCKECTALLKLRTIVLKEDIQIIYTNSVVTFSGAIISFFHKIPHVWHIKEILPENPDLKSILPLKYLFRFISYCSTHIISISNAAAQQFSPLNISRKMTVIYEGFDFCDLPERDSTPSIREISEKDWVITVVGSLQRRKAPDDAIRAVKIAIQKIPTLKLLLVGKGERAYIKYLRKLIIELGLVNKAILIGHRNDVYQILLKSKLSLMPSLDEPFGKVVLEAMAMGKPVIGVNSGGVKEIIQHGVTGFLVPPGSPEKIAENIIRLFENPDLLNKLGTNAKSYIKDNFAMQKYIENMENILMGAL